METIHTNPNNTSEVINNHIELLIFSLFNKDTQKHQNFGIDVFKVREVIETPSITSIPNPPEGIAGIISLRGKTFSVLDLSGYLKINKPSSERKMLIIVEYSDITIGLLIDKVNTIIRKTSEDIKEPPRLIDNGYVSSITQHNESLVSVLDIDKILSHIE